MKFTSSGATTPHVMLCFEFRHKQIQRLKHLWFENDCVRRAARRIRLLGEASKTCLYQCHRARHFADASDDIFDLLLRLIQETKNETFIRGSPMPAVIGKRVGTEIVMRSQRGSLRRFLHGLSFSASFSILGNEPIRFRLAREPAQSRWGCQT